MSTITINIRILFLNTNLKLSSDLIDPAHKNILDKILPGLEKLRYMYVSEELAHFFENNLNRPSKFLKKFLLCTTSIQLSMLAGNTDYHTNTYPITLAPCRVGPAKLKSVSRFICK